MRLKVGRKVIITRLEFDNSVATDLYNKLINKVGILIDDNERSNYPYTVRFLDDEKPYLFTISEVEDYEFHKELSEILKDEV